MLSSRVVATESEDDFEVGIVRSLTVSDRLKAAQLKGGVVDLANMDDSDSEAAHAAALAVPRAAPPLLSRSQIRVKPVFTSVSDWNPRKASACSRA